jgi:hypothetical protein
MRRRGLRLGLAGVIAAGAWIGLCPEARAQSIPDPGEGVCVNAQCLCNGTWVTADCSITSCESVCGGGSNGSSDSSGGNSGGPGLFGALANLFATPEATPEQIQAAAAAAAAREKEVADAQAAYDASASALQSRIARGRDLDAAWAAYQDVLQTARQGQLDPQAVLRTMVPLPKRDRIPVTAIGQAHCAAFHGELADKMESWRHRSSPDKSPMWRDDERQAYEASALFDTGTAVAGCDRYTPQGLGAPVELVDLRPATGELRRVLPALKPAAEELAQAEAAYRKADEHFRSLQDGVAKQVQAVKDLSATFDEMKKKVEAGKAEEAKLDAELKRLAWAKQRLDMHKLFDEKLAEQGRAHEHLAATDRLMRETEQQVAAATKDAEARKQALEDDRRLYEAGLKLWEEKKRAVEELDRKRQEAEKLFARPGVAPSGYYLGRPRLVRP